MSVSMDSVRRLLEDLKKFESMDSSRKGAFRARVTRYLNKVENPDVKKILEAIREKVGEAEARTTARLTVEDLEAELPKFAGYDSKRRGAYKAKATRLLNEAKDKGDTDKVARLQVIQNRIDSLEREEAIAGVLNLAEELGLDLGDEEE